MSIEKIGFIKAKNIRHLKRERLNVGLAGTDNIMYLHKKRGNTIKERVGRTAKLVSGVHEKIRGGILSYGPSAKKAYELSKYL